jgi:hypothetical protein
MSVEACPLTSDEDDAPVLRGARRPHAACFRGNTRPRDVRVRTSRCRRRRSRGEHRANPELVTATRAFNTLTITVGGLYLTTHSIIVTIIGTAASLFGCWTRWLAR